MADGGEPSNAQQQDAPERADAPGLPEAGILPVLPTALQMPVPMFNVKPPDPVKLDKSKNENWKLWKQLWTHYTIASNLDHPSRSPNFKKSLLISTMGVEALQIYNGCDPSDEDTCEDILQKLDTFILGETNEIFERYKFNSRQQQNGESVDSYLNSLKILRKTCNFCDCMKDSLIRDRLVLGVLDERIRKRLFQERKIDLKKCIDICHSYENTSNQMKVISGKLEEVEVHKVMNKGNYRPSNKYPKHKPKANYHTNSGKFKPTGNATTGSPALKCKFCGKMHPRKKELCPAWGKRCSKCNAMNHFAVCCSTKSRIHGVDASDSDYEYALSVHDDQVNSVSTGPIYAEMTVKNGKRIKFQVDSGATVNVIPVKLVDTRVKLEHSDTRLTMYNKSKIQPVGKCTLILHNSATSQKYHVEFQVVEQDLQPLISRETAERMQLITVNYDNFKQLHSVTQKSSDVLENYGMVFNGNLGRLPGTVNVKISEYSKGVQCPSRRVPVSVKPKLKEELDKLVKQGVITPVAEPTEWCSQISIQTKKSGKLRICVDPRPLNEVLQRERYPLPTMDDILPELANAKVFSKVDLAHGYWHCVLDEESSYVTTFISPFGRFRWNRLPFGLKVSSEIFQRKLNESLSGLTGVACIADDILVYGTSTEDHNKNLQHLLDRCQTVGIQLNREKSVFHADEIDFMGHTITANGLKPDVKKLEAILQMENPSDVEGVRRMLGLVNYLAKFLPRLATVVEPLRRLTRLDCEWQWSEEQDKAMNELKKLITTAPILVYYDPAKALVVQCDASSTGLGAALLQDGKPIAYASRALSTTETRYAQIEKECLAIVFAMERFHQYTFGRLTIINSDHKPLEMIVKKPLHKAPKRLQGMLMRLLHYDTEIVYKRGKEMYIADTLSRAYLPNTNNKADQFEEINAVGSLRISPERLNELKIGTNTDETMAILKSAINKGWPDGKELIPTQITPYYSYRDELAVHDGLIFKGERVVVPPSIRKAIKEHLHTSHLGGDSMLRRARD